MNSREDFEKWWQESGKRDTLCKGWAGEVWNARQPEIDALKAEVAHWQAMAEDSTSSTYWKLEGLEADAKFYEEANTALKDEVNRLKGMLYTPNLNTIMQREMERLQDENKTLREDSERYRWLRGNVERFGEEIQCVDDEGSHGYFQRYITPEECDAAIDAAMKEEE